MYLGQYLIEIQNGKIEFPQKFCNEKEKLWAVICYTEGGESSSVYMIADSDSFAEYVSAQSKDVDAFEIKAKGKLLLDSCNMWEIPDIIADYLVTDDIVLLGAGAYIEIMSVKDMDTLYNELENFEGLLKITDL